MTFYANDPDWLSAGLLLTAIGIFCLPFLIKFMFDMSAVHDGIGESKILTLDEHAESVEWVNDRDDFDIWDEQMREEAS